MRKGNRAELESSSRSSKPRVIWRQRFKPKPQMMHEATTESPLPQIELNTCL